jgi:hypothetical protein
MYSALSAYTGVPGQQQAPHDVRTSEGQAERPWHTIQTSSSWFYMGRRGLLSKYTKYK